MDDLHDFNEPKLYQKLFLPDERFEEWLKEAGLLPQSCSCDKCGGEMTLKFRERDNYPTWRCGKRVEGKKCGREIGYLKGTFFEGSHLPLKDIFRLSFYFCRQTHTQELIQFDMERANGDTLGSATISDWMEFFREVCFLYFEKHPVRLGGPGMVVEIDETVISRRKYNRGRLIREQVWFFGGVERGSGRCFIIPVERRDAATLLPIIQNFILPGTTIMSDMWAAYGRIDQLPELYQHYTVNHSENFVDPDTGAYTQTIESTWNQFKRRHKEEMGTARHLLVSYIFQFVWKRQFGGRSAMFHLWSQIQELYPQGEVGTEELAA